MSNPEGVSLFDGITTDEIMDELQRRMDVVVIGGYKHSDPELRGETSHVVLVGGDEFDFVVATGLIETLKSELARSVSQAILERDEDDSE